MVRRCFLTAALVLVAGAFAPAIPAAAAADPAALISNLGSRALEVLGKDANQSQRVARFRELLREDFDVPGIARFVLPDVQQNVERRHVHMQLRSQLVHHRAPVRLRVLARRQKGMPAQNAKRGNRIHA
jgi:ABC-type transporter MlaC component